MCEIQRTTPKTHISIRISGTSSCRLLNHAINKIATGNTHRNAGAIRASRV